MIDFSSMRGGKKAASTSTPAAAVTTPVSTAPTATSTTNTSTPTPSTTQPTPKVKSSDAGSKMLQLAMARLEGKNIKSTDEIATPADKTVEVSKESAKADVETTTSVNVSAAATAVVDNNKVNEKEVNTSKDTTTEQKIETIVDSSNEIAKKSSLQEQLSKSIETPVENDTSAKMNETMNAVANEFHVYTKDFLLRYVDRSCM